MVASEVRDLAAQTRKVVDSMVGDMDCIATAARSASDRFVEVRGSVDSARGSVDVVSGAAEATQSEAKELNHAIREVEQLAYAQVGLQGDIEQAGFFVGHVGQAAKSLQAQLESSGGLAVRIWMEAAPPVERSAARSLDELEEAIPDRLAHGRPGGGRSAH